MTSQTDPSERPPVLSGPKRQHYLPRFYLKGFAGADGCVAVFDRSQNECRRQSPDNTAVIGHFYTLTDEEDRQRYEIEKTLSEIEASASQAIQRLLRDGGCGETDRFHIAYFVATLAVRTPSFVDSMKHGNSQLLRRVFSHMYGDEESAMRGLRSLDDREWESEDEMRRVAKLLVETADSGDYEFVVDQQHAVSMSLGLADELVPIFLERDWVLIDAPQRSAFVVADTGVALSRRFPSPSWRGIGYGSPEALTLVPLSSRTVLAMFGRSQRFGRQAVDSAKVREVNMELARGTQRFLFGRDDRLVQSVAEAAGLPQGSWKPKFTVS